MLSFPVRSTRHHRAMYFYLSLLMDAHGFILWYSYPEIYASSRVHIPHHLVYSSMLWWRCRVLSGGHNHRSSTRLAVCRFDELVANARTSMVLITTSSRIHLCTASVCGLLHVRALRSISTRSIPPVLRMASVHLWHVRHWAEDWVRSHSLWLSDRREREIQCTVSFFLFEVLDVCVRVVRCVLSSHRRTMIIRMNMRYYHLAFTLHTTRMTMIKNQLVWATFSSTIGCSCLFCLHWYPSKRRLSCWSVTPSVFRWVSGWPAFSHATGSQESYRVFLVQLCLSRYMRFSLIISMEFCEWGNQSVA